MAARASGRWIFEGSLIVVSVLTALVIDAAVEQRKLAREKRAAVERIALELEANVGIVERWLERHAQLGRRLGEIVADPESEARRQLEEAGFFDLGVVFGGESFIDASLSSSAWEATRAKGLLTEFDYETVQRLTDVYSLQRILSEQTIARFSTAFFDLETHRPENLDGVLLQFRLLISELVGQEAILAQLYADALEHLESPAG